MELDKLIRFLAIFLSLIFGAFSALHGDRYGPDPENRLMSVMERPYPHSSMARRYVPDSRNETGSNAHYVKREARRRHKHRRKHHPELKPTSTEIFHEAQEKKWEETGVAVDAVPVAENRIEN